MPRVTSVVSPVFVGRRGVFEGFADSFAQARQGDPAVVLVSGEAGVGKTRLLEEAGRRAAEDGARVLVGGSVELGEGVPFAPLVEALRTLALRGRRRDARAPARAGPLRARRGSSPSSTAARRSTTARSSPPSCSS